ncbi:S24 family peptidase [Pedobacter suwonensis]|uniref:S24 family peptidase n=1 Tax=Pedobacter suwonensis TaxID=332999 RepID=UPI001644D327|nr:S24/S26 family peptidase [Pedobacter suwonensis]
MANAYIQNSNNRKGEIGSSILQRLATEYLDLNIIWLITGNGDMLVTPNNNDIENANTPNDNKGLLALSDTNSVQDAPPTLAKIAPPTAPPTQNFGMPKVIAINENNEDLVTLVGAKAAAGYLNGYGDTEFIENLPTIRLPTLKGGTHRAFEVSGHSMQPTIQNGSIAVGRWVEELDEIRDRRIYILVTKTDGIVIKRVLNKVKETGNLILISDNPNKNDYYTYPLEASNIIEAWYLRGAFIFNFQEPGELYNRFNDLEAKVTLMADQLQKLAK